MKTGASRPNETITATAIRELEAERRARQKMSPAGRKQHDRERDAPLATIRLGSDPKRAKLFLLKLAMRLQDGEILRSEVRGWLASGLIEIALNPKQAAKTFGLTKPRGRPRTDRAAMTRALLDVEQRIANGTRLNDSKNGSGALTLAASKHGIESETLAREWKSLPRPPRRK